MLRQYLWKLLLSLAIVTWAVAELIPFKDRPFDQYIKAEAGNRPAEFAALMKEGSDRVASGQAQTLFVALKQIGKERKLDLSQILFTDLNLGTGASQAKTTPRPDRHRTTSSTISAIAPPTMAGSGFSRKISMALKLTV